MTMCKTIILPLSQIYSQVHVIDNDSDADSNLEEPKAISNHHKIKVMILNCCNIQSSRKNIKFRALVDTHSPDVILGTEFHIDNSIKTAEAFPESYQITRNDRDLNGGGVFTAVHTLFVSAEETSLTTECEITWSKLSLNGSKPL